MPDILLEVKGLKKYFPIKTGLFSKVIGYVKAVDDVTFSIKRGETLGLVGESGCGKTTVGRALLRLIEPTAGEIIFDGKNITNISQKDLKDYRKEMQIIFQDPYSSLNPRITVGGMLTEIFKFHEIAEGEAAEGLPGLHPRPDQRHAIDHSALGAQKPESAHAARGDQ